MGALVLYLLVLGAAFVAGRWVVPRWLVVGAAVGALGVPVVLSVGRPAMAPQFATSYLVFVVLPVAAGAYLRQHRRLLTVLRERQDELAERERLRERLRISRDMHDSVTNPVVGRRPGAGAGLGLSGLRERVEPAGGFLDHRAADGRFRLVAMLPTTPVPEPETGRVRATALGVATGALLFFLLPATMLTGVS